MKRAVWPLLLCLVCVTGLLTMKGAFPLLPVSGNSMAPTLEHGTLLVIKTAAPGDIKVGDIVICNVPATERAYYNYPPVIVRRVTAVTAEPSLLFRTGSDNAGKDPFPIKPGDIRGIAGSGIPYLGLVPLLFQDWLWLLFVLPVLALLGVFLYRREIVTAIFRMLRRSPTTSAGEEKAVTRTPAREKEIIIEPADAAGPPRPEPEKPALKVPGHFVPARKKEPPVQKVPPEKSLTEEALAARRAIYDALDRLHNQADKPEGQE